MKFVQRKNEFSQVLYAERYDFLWKSKPRYSLVKYFIMRERKISLFNHYIIMCRKNMKILNKSDFLMFERWCALMLNSYFFFFFIHSGTLKIAPQEGKKILSWNFAPKTKNIRYANDPSLETMHVTVHPVVALQSGRERHLNER